MRKSLLSALLLLCIVLSLMPTARAADDLLPDEAQQAPLSEPEAESIAAASLGADGWGAIELDGEIIGEVNLDPPADWFEQESGPMPVSENIYSGQAKLKDSNEVRWIDRLDLPDEVINLYNVLEEAADGDGYNDYLIDDEYFDLSGNFDPTHDGEPGSYMRLEFKNSHYAAILVAAIEPDNSYKEYIDDCCVAARSAFTMDHPEVFWMGSMTSMWYQMNGKIYICCVLSYDRTDGEGTRTFDARKAAFQPGGGWDIREQIDRRDAAVENILSTIPDGADRYTQVYCINDWLTENNEYNTLVSKGEEGPWYAWTCLSALTGSKGVDGPVCQGFAVAFKILCDTLDIPCVSVRGDVWYSPTELAGYHEWNYLQMEDGKWYAMDVTWNSVPDNTKWFLLGSKTLADNMEFLASHPAENWFSRGGLWFTNGPVLSETAYGPLLRYSGMPDSLAIGDSVNLTAKLTRTTGNADYVYSVQPALPSGLALDPDSGRITGTANAIAGAVNVKVTVTSFSDSADSATYILKFPAVEGSVRTVSFDANGGTLGGSTTAATSAYGKLSSLPALSRAGYTFTGWYTENAGGTRVTADTVFTKDTTIYAHWVSSSSPSSGTCGYNLNWIYEDGVLTISGTGDMGIYGNPNDNGTPPPWYDRREQIQTINICDGVTSAGQYAFYGCSNLTSVNIPVGVTSIGYGTFCDCSSLKTVTIPNGVTGIGHLAFYGCGSLERADIPSSVLTIGQWAFRECSSLKSVTIPSGVSKIESSIFYGCSSLERVDIPSSVVTIGEWAFGGCSSLKRVDIPGSVLTIESRAFSNCGSLYSVTIPESVGSIGYAAFYACESLRDVYYGGGSEQWEKIEIDQFNDSLTGAVRHYDSLIAEGSDIAARLDRASQTVHVVLRDQTGNTLVCAAYSPGGQLADLAVKPVSAERISVEFSKKLPENYYVTLMLVDSSAWRPLREAYLVA